ncbi:MAG: helix-turn-helix domain-containing protein [Pseudohongiellaceae bacterium]
MIKSKPLRTPGEIFGSEDLFALSERIITSGALGRSKNYRALLQYLVQCSIEGKSPKELEIAIDVLGRNNDFDVSVDSTVRVYVHQLRKKLDAYFEKQGAEEDYRIVVPKGSNHKEILTQACSLQGSYYSL